MRFGRLLGFALILSAPIAEARPTRNPQNDAYPRSLPEMKAMIQLLAPRKGAAGSMQNEFISRLRQHRYICGVPYENLSWDATYANLTYHASLVCARLNKMTHTPEKPPGMADAEYELGRKGAGESNLFSGMTDPGPCVDGWMDDSDPTNIDRVGHRRWCLNPSMQKSAFGRVDKYAAMYAFDRGNKDVPDWDFVAYPARGYMPIPFFGSRHAWSVSPNMAKYAAPVQAQVKVTIHAADAKHNPVGSPLKLDYFKVETGGFGSGPAIIFRPAGFNAAQEGIYLVEINGLKPAKGGAAPIKYVVHMVNLQKAPDGPEGPAAITKYFQQRLTWVQGLNDWVDQAEALSEMTESEFLGQAEASVRSSLQKLLAELLKDPTVKKEHTASQRYRQLVALEQKAGTAKTQLAQVARAYRDLSVAYKDTRAGKMAAEAFERLKTQLQ